ncbi:MAG: hypothetical protein JXA96_09770 [Sedimentisphaerales bacterium]|nr:hypothetical protein [Sedimentisphaerales bacterium]
MLKNKYLCLIYLGVFVFALYLSSPATYAIDKMDNIWGGECKQTCKKEGDCDGKSSCPGNCYGADNGADCGKDLKYAVSGDVWKCGAAIEGGGGCNFQDAYSVKDVAAWPCLCSGGDCDSSTSSSTTCTYYTKCFTD